MLGLSKNRMFPSSCVNQHFSTFKENTPEIGRPSFLNQPISCQFHFVGYTLLHPRKCHQQKADFTPHKTADTSWSIYIYVYIYICTQKCNPTKDGCMMSLGILLTLHTPLTNLWVCSGTNHFGIRTRGMKCFIYIYIYTYIYIYIYMYIQLCSISIL